MIGLSDTMKDGYTGFEDLQNEALNKAPQGDRMGSTWKQREISFFRKLFSRNPYAPPHWGFSFSANPS